jgi:myo-inositol-1(or 4)-monophosphatase
MELRIETAHALEAVSQGLDLALRGPTGARIKGEGDIVTATDIAVEDLVRSELEPLRLPVVGEERGGERGAAYWLVDPICGTRNFAHRLPLWCVNVALVEDGAVSAAVVGQPDGTLVAAELGAGAWRVAADGPASALRAGRATKILVVEEGHAAGERRARTTRAVAALLEAGAWDFRAFGTTLTLAWLAAGDVDACLIFDVSAVHSAAGSLVAAEAGATVTDIDGAPWTLASDSIVASATAELHQELLGLLR